MILKALGVLVVLIVAILIFAATKPSTFHIQRSIDIQAPPDKVFPLIDDLHNWPQWAPQDREDSTMKRTFSGPKAELGRCRTGAGPATPARAR